jgi:hypothetical protein
VSVGRSAIEFLWGVLKRFYIWLPTVLLDPFDLYERYLKQYLPKEYQFDFKLPTPLFLSVLAICLTAAGILTYHELRTKVVSTAANDGRRRAVDEVSRLRSEAIHRLLNGPVKNDSELSRWITEEEIWREAVEKVLRANFGEATVRRFSDLGTLPGATFPSAYNGRHNHQLLMLSKRLGVMEGLLERAGT